MICTFIVILFSHSKLLKDTPYATGDEMDFDNNNGNASDGNGDVIDDDSTIIDQMDHKFIDTNEQKNLIDNINDNNANKIIIMDVSDCEKDKANDGDNETSSTMSPTKCKDDKDSDSAKIRQTAVLVESDGFVTKNGHRVVIQSQQHSRSPSTTSRSADV